MMSPPFHLLGFSPTVKLKTFNMPGYNSPHDTLGHFQTWALLASCIWSAGNTHCIADYSLWVYRNTINCFDFLSYNSFISSKSFMWGLLCFLYTGSCQLWTLIILLLPFQVRCHLFYCLIALAGSSNVILNRIGARENILSYSWS